MLRYEIEGGAMSWMSPNMVMSTKALGRMFSGDVNISTSSD